MLAFYFYQDKQRNNGKPNLNHQRYSNENNCQMAPISCRKSSKTPNSYSYQQLHHKLKEKNIITSINKPLTDRENIRIIIDRYIDNWFINYWPN